MIPDYPKSVSYLKREAAGLRYPTPGRYFQEKFDGSQFSFALDSEGVLWYKTKNTLVMDTGGDIANGLFKPTIEHVRSIAHKLSKGLVYRGEAMKGAKHNKQAYDRAPRGHLVLYDIHRVEGWFHPHAVALVAEELGLEPCPWWVSDTIDNEAWLSEPSSLGGPREGWVVKDAYYTYRNHPYIGKSVSERFKEMDHAKLKVPGKDVFNEMVTSVQACYSTSARFRKTVQHLEEEGRLTNTMADLKHIVPMVLNDILEEEEQSIKDYLFDAMWKKYLSKAIAKPIQKWYDAHLNGEDTPLAFDPES